MKWYWSKYPTWVKVLVIIGVVIGIGMALSDAFKGSQKAGDWLSNPDRSSLQAEEVVSSSKTNTRTASIELKVKGFYLGMNIDDAANVLGEYVKFRPEVELLSNYSIAQKMAPGCPLAVLLKNAPNTKYAIASLGGFHIEADSDKKVARIAFFSDFSNKFFNSIYIDI